MKVIYDNSLRVGGIGISPWTRLGPERWFPNYKIASFFGADDGVEGLPPIFSIHGQVEVLPRFNSVNLLKEPAFQTLLQDNFSDYKLFTYKTAEAPDHIEQYLLRPDEQYMHVAKTLENKAAFRRLFSSDDIKFPEFVITTKEAFMEISLQQLLHGRPAVIVQDAEMSGGKGTFFVTDEPSLLKAKAVLAKGAATEVVVSNPVSQPNERSIQCVATEQGIFMGPAQVQIIDEPLLINRTVVGAEKFCGMVIDAELTPRAQVDSMRSTAARIGEKIVTMGYRGIFGVDFLVDDNGEIFVLEVNPRITGATPLLTAMYSSESFVPFYLLHILEIMKQEYRIEQSETDRNEYENLPAGSLMVLHSQEAVRVEVLDTLRTGIYSSELEFIKPTVAFDDMKDGEYLIQSIAPVGVKASPAARLLTIYYKGSVLDKEGKIREKVRNDIESIYTKIKLKEVTEE